MLRESFGTDRTTIHLLKLEDLEEVRSMHNEPSTLNQLSDARYVTTLMQESWFQKLQESVTSFRYVCRNKESNVLVGVFRIDNLDTSNQSIMIGLDIAQEFRRNGYATEIYEFFIEYLFNDRYFHRLYFSTLSTNLAAQGLYKKLGFLPEGIQRDAIFRNGEYIDLINYSLINAYSKHI